MIFLKELICFLDLSYMVIGENPVESRFSAIPLALRIGHILKVSSYPVR
jgi:hypothetical protein